MPSGFVAYVTIFIIVYYMAYILSAIFAVLLNQLSGAIVKTRDVTMNNYDVGWNVIPDLRKYNKGNILNDGLLFVSSVILLLNFNRIPTDFFKVFAIAFTARAITTTVTTFRDETKKEDAPGIKNWAHDKIFSGHVMISILISYYTGILWPVLPILSSIFTIATREHYTIDVVISWLLFFSAKYTNIK